MKKERLRDRKREERSVKKAVDRDFLALVRQENAPGEKK